MDADSPRSSPAICGKDHLLEQCRSQPESWVEGLTASSGSQFLHWLVHHLAASLEIDCALVGGLRGPDWDRVQTVAVWQGGEIRENFEYDLAGTPCADVVRQQAFCYQQGVSRSFPDDKVLRTMGAESDVGVPLTDGSGRPLGLMVLVDGSPLSPGKARLASEVLDLFQARAASELACRRSLAELEQLVKGVALTGEGETFGAMVQFLGHAMHVKGAFVSVLVDVERGRVRTEGLSVAGELLEDFEYALAGTPCQEV